MWSSLFTAIVLAVNSSTLDTLIVPLKEIVVTGTRVRESAFRAPSSISVIDRRAFSNGRELSLSDALGGVPGVFVQSRSGAQDVRITIRGYGARGNGDRSNAGNIRGIRVLTDGIPVSEPDGRTSLDLVDLGATDRIEVSRSNGTSIYGNASGGVVNLTTNLSFEKPFVRFEQRAGSFGFHREQGVLGFAAGRGRGTVSLANSTFEGWRAHSSSSATLAHLRFASPLGDASKLTLISDLVSTLNRFPGALTAAELATDREQANPTYVARDERRWNRVGRVAATLEHALDEKQDMTVSLWAEPKVLQRSERNRFRDFNRIHTGGSALYSSSYALTEGIEARTTLGADEAFQDGSIMFYGLTPSGGRDTAVIANKREAANSAGGFLQQTVTWNDRWSAQIAARYDNLWYIAQDRIEPDLNATKRFTRVTPKGSISYRLANHTIFASLGGGVESPAFNEIDPGPPYDAITSLNPFLDAMRSTTYEIGARGVLGSAVGPWRYDAAIYQIETSNEIVPQNGGGYFTTAGRSQRIGAELTLDWQPLTSLVLHATGSFSNNEYKRYTNELGDFSGNDMPGLPRLFFASSGRAKLPQGFSAELGVSGSGNYFADDANTAEAEAYHLVNATLDWSRDLPRGTVRAFVSGANLLDQDHVASVFINGLAGRYYEPGLPLNVSGGLSVSWR
ncbi:MAG: TonB-dependent receptor [Candidatus Eisenbacteria bacterium]